MSAEKITLNIALSDGALPVGCKVEGDAIVRTLQPTAADPSCPAGVTFAEFSDAVQRFFVFAGGTLYTSLNGSYYINVYTMAGDLPFLLNQRDDNGLYASFVCGGYNLFHRGPENRYVKTFKTKVGGCVFKNGRYFGIDLDDRRKIRWSGTGGIYDWTEGFYGAGWAYTDEENGDILKLLVYDDKILAVCEHGFSQISAYGAPENFRVLKSDLRTAAIAKNTVAIIGGRVAFYSASGLYLYDGSKVTQVSCPLLDSFEGLDFAVAYGEKYYACGYNERLERRCIICIDTTCGSAFLVDCPAHALCVHDGVYAYTDGGVCKLERSTTWQFFGGDTDFGTSDKKALKCVETLGGSAEIRAESEGESRTMTGVKGRFLPNVCGRTFKFSIKSAAEKLRVIATAEVPKRN